MLKTKNLLLILLVAMLVGVLSVGGYMLFKDRQPPTLSLTPASGHVNAHTEFTFGTTDHASGLRTYAVTLVSADKTISLGNVSPEPGQTSAELAFTLEGHKIKDGPIELQVVSTDASYAEFGKGNTSRATYSLTLDSKKPRINVQTMAHNINRGGSAFIIYTINEDVASSGVAVGERLFKGYKQPDGRFFCLFALPYDVEVADFKPTLTARDLAGNEARRGFNHHVNDKPFRHDVINLPDSFLDNKMPQYEDIYPDAPTQLERFLLVNGELRTRNRARMAELSNDSVPQMLWTGTFGRLPNAANRARFGDQRTYRHSGEDVDFQTHLGIDLASTKAAPIPCANAGIVVHTGFFGIYGESVVVDHGLGLMTLYSHMSQIDVEVGDEVQRDTILGRTGATGMAGGDHLHFAIWLSGVPVQPIEWWDARWIDHNVTGKM